MSHRPSVKHLRLDPWVASSLMQKAIRRGEVELAQTAAREFRRHRGTAIFRRLCTIAVEDIGIGDIALLQDVVRIGTDKALRAILGSDEELVGDLCVRMAGATKDRSADYLYSAATKLETAVADRAHMERLSFADLCNIATDDGLPLVQRAVAALSACRGKDDDSCDAMRVGQYLKAFTVRMLPLEDAVERLVRSRPHPFCVLLPLVWSSWWFFGCRSEVATDPLPPTEYFEGLPAYALDKHTAAGKLAISRLVRENGDVAGELANWVPERSRTEVAGLAAFYVDAAPVAQRLAWHTGALLAQIGAVADLSGAGCAGDGVLPIISCLGEHLPHLNLLRRAAWGGAAK